MKPAFRGIAITEFFYVAGRFRLMPGLEGCMFRAPDPWDCKSFPLVGFPLCPGFVYDKFHFMSYLIKNHTLIYSCFSHAVIIRVSKSKFGMHFNLCLGQSSAICGPNAACGPSISAVRHANYFRSTKKLMWNLTNHFLSAFIPNIIQLHAVLLTALHTSLSKIQKRNSISYTSNYRIIWLRCL